MINPNAKHRARGVVQSISKRLDGTIRNVDVKFSNGAILYSPLNFQHKTLKVGDTVTCRIGFRIFSDSYVIETIRKVLK